MAYTGLLKDGKIDSNFISGEITPTSTYITAYSTIDQNIAQLVQQKMVFDTNSVVSSGITFSSPSTFIVPATGMYKVSYCITPDLKPTFPNPTPGADAGFLFSCIAVDGTLVPNTTSGSRIIYDYTTSNTLCFEYIVSADADSGIELILQTASAFMMLLPNGFDLSYVPSCSVSIVRIA
jgi:hypothetical protein